MTIPSRPRCALGGGVDRRFGTACEAASQAEDSRTKQHDAAGLRNLSAASAETHTDQAFIISWDGGSPTIDPQHTKADVSGVTTATQQCHFLSNIKRNVEGIVGQAADICPNALVDSHLWISGDIKLPN